MRAAQLGKIFIQKISRDFAQEVTCLIIILFSIFFPSVTEVEPRAFAQSYSLGPFILKQDSINLYVAHVGLEFAILLLQFLIKLLLMLA